MFYVKLQLMFPIQLTRNVKCINDYVLLQSDTMQCQNKWTRCYHYIIMFVFVFFSTCRKQMVGSTGSVRRRQRVMNVSIKENMEVNVQRATSPIFHCINITEELQQITLIIHLLCTCIIESNSLDGYCRSPPLPPFACTSALFIKLAAIGGILCHVSVLQQYLIHCQQGTIIPSGLLQHRN